MKFLLIASMLAASAFANANERDIKCYERSNGDVDVAYIIKSGHDVTMSNGWLKLFDCRHNDSLNCDFRGTLKKVERQEENCLVLNRDNISHDGWSLCREEQLAERRLVPVTITDDRQESRAYCDREILRYLRD